MKSSIKNLIITTIAASALMCAPVFAQQNVSVQIDGIPLETDVPAQIIEGRTMVPMRAIFEALGTEIEWDADTKTVTASQGGASVVMQVGSKEFTVLGAKNTLDVAPCIIDGRTLVPVRAVSESFECEVNWSAEEKVVSIITPDYKPYPEAEENTKDTENGKSETSEISADISTDDVKKTLISEDMAPAPIILSSMDQTQAQLHEKARYAFEQSALPKALFGDETYKARIKDSTEGFSQSIAYIWASAVSGTVFDYLANSEEEFSFASEEESKAFLERFYKDCNLMIDQNIGCSYWSGNGDYYVLLEMADDNYLGSCKYILISYNDTEGFRIRTMEKSFNDMSAFCEITADGRQTDYAIYSTDRKADFLNYIFG